MVPHPLAAHVLGPVLSPGDEGFADEVLTFNRAVVHTPELVVGATTTADVVAAVRWASEHGLPLTVLATGHGATVPVRSGLIVTTRRISGVVVDGESRVATIGAGALWSDVVPMADAVGLAAVAGASTVVGVVGYLLGGGLGPLARSHGFSSDRVESFTVVTGTGEVVEASATDHADLFWALRGGRGGLGVVTEVRVRLVSVPELYAGSLLFDTEHVSTVLRGWLAWTPTADESTTTSAAIVRFPSVDAVPPPMRGRTVLMLRFARPGDAQSGALAAAPLRALAPVMTDGVGVLPVAQTDRIHGAGAPVPGPSWGRSLMLTSADDDLASAVLEHSGPDADHPFMAVELRHVSGATAHDVAGGSAVSGRGPAFTFGVAGADPTTFETVLPSAAAAILEALAPWTSEELNPNFAGMSAARWSEPTTDRLREVRRRYDPAGVFSVASPGEAEV
ncbi:FAD-dependent oxidoreductase [Cellulomonas sp. URHE0023]|uniref:FAD-binding oxidoreductase n=1 Tax=Cellulomonas sp. URHE0023 TaxID=1380354 RepID=UPI00048910A6|nr:FAD-dependent oxidoreductase [Cellulomonas sp. URHE0023]